MKIFYDSNKLKRQFGNASEIKKAFGELAKKILARMAEIEAAPNLAVLQKVPAAKCHPLTGNRDGEWAVSISGNYRIIFIIAHSPIPINDEGLVDTILITDISITGTEDYH